MKTNRFCILPRRFALAGGLLLVWLTTAVSYAAVLDVIPGSPYISPIAEVVLDDNGTPVTQTASQSGVIATRSTEVNLVSIELVDGTILDEFDLVAAEVTLLEFDTYQPGSGIGVLNSDGSTVPLTAANKEPFRLAAEDAVSNLNLNNYIYYDSISPVKPTAGIPDFDVRFAFPILPDDHIFVLERYGNTFFEVVPLDYDGNPIAGANVLKFGGNGGSPYSVYDWNTGYANSTYQSGQALAFSVSLSSNFFVGTAVTPQAVYGLRIDNNGEADVKFFGLSDDTFTNNLGSIGDFVWADINGDGDQDGSEPGIAGVVVELRDGNGDLVATTVTASDGSYSFDLLPADDFTLTFIPPSGYEFSPQGQGGNAALDSDPNPVTGVASVTLAQGEVNDDIDAGLIRRVPLGDRIWLDEDGDGIQDAGESGIANVVVELYDATGTILLGTTTTDSEGNYLFTDLAPGTYTVQVDPASMPADLAANPTYDLDGTGTPNTAVAMLTSDGGGNFDADFGYNWAPTTDVVGGNNAGAIGDRVWIDANGDGVQDPGEAGLAGITVELWVDSNFDGMIDTNDMVLATVITDENGNYLFDELLPDIYKVVVNGGADVAGYTQTGDPDGTLDNQTSDPIVLAPGDVYVNADFGYQPTPGGPVDNSVAGTVYFDTDGDGAPNGSDYGIPNVSVSLIEDLDGDGIWDPSFEVIGGLIDINDDGVITAADDDALRGITIIDGRLDLDGDGDIDANDAGTFQGVDVIAGQLDLDGNGTANDNGSVVGEPIIATQNTDTNGDYLFDGLPDGDYVVWVNDTGSVLSGLDQTDDPDVALDDATGVGLDAAGVNGTSVDSTGNNFGYTAPGQTAGQGLIGDTIFLDTNQSGDVDPGEGLEGVTVELYDATGTTLLASTVTDENGNYVFGDLDDATYVVRVDVSTLPNNGVGLLNTVDPEAPFGDSESSVVISGGNIDLDQDFGYEPAVPNTIGGTIWDDRDADGFLLPDGLDGLPATADDEVGIEGVTVVLRDSDGNIVATTTTDANGDYSFPGLPDGTYTVDVTDEANLLDGQWHSIGTPTLDSNSQSDPYTVSVSGGATNTTGDFGYYETPAAIGNFVWDDLNGDGIQDPGEPGISNVTVNLYILWPTGGGLTVLTTMTDTNGFYSFDGLLADENHDGVNGDVPTFLVDMVVPIGYTESPIYEGGDPELDSNAHDGEFPIPVQGQQDNSFDFGLIQLGTIVGTVFEDVDSKGNKGPEDTNTLAGVTIQLVDDGGSIIATTTTGPDGSYTFTNVVPGDYTLREIDPGGYVSTTDTDGGSAHVSAVTVPPGGSDRADFWDTLSTTYVLLSKFSGAWKEDEAVLTWETSAEVGTMGFFLSRSASVDGSYEPVTEGIIPGLITSPQGGVYEQVDTGVEANSTWFYRLVEVDAQGKRSVFGPFEVQYEAATSGRTRRSVLAQAAARRATGKAPASKARAHQNSRQQNQLIKDARVSRSSQAAAKRKPRGEAGAALGLRVEIQEPGVQRMDLHAVAAELEVTLQALIKDLKRKKYVLSHRGQRVTYRVEGDTLLFYAAPLVDTFTADDVFWLKFGGRALHMSTVSASPEQGDSWNSGSSPDTFTQVAVIEENHGNFIHLFDEVDADYWYWDFLLAGNATRGVKSFNLPTPGLAAGPARLVVNLHGYTSLSAEPEHHAVIELNGVELGEVIWDGATPAQLGVDLPEGLLVDGDNSVTITALLDAGVPYGAFVLEDFEVAYPRYYQPSEGVLALHADATGTVRVRGLGSEAVSVFDTTNTGRPRVLEGLKVEPDGDAWQVSFIAEADHDYYVVEEQGLREVVHEGVSLERPLLDRSTKTDYLVIVPEGLEAGAQELADYRASQGHAVQLAGLQDIYDTFNHGMSSPHAIRAFLKFTHRKWQVAPRYVVLAGSATYDYKDYMGLGGNLVPAIMVSTPFGLFASDAAMADFDGNGTPEVALGRLPALSNEELIEQLLKIMEYENSTDSWKQHIALVADNNDEGGNFHDSSDQLEAAFGPQYTREKIYLGELATGEARSALLDALANGSGLINYVGHGGADRVTAEGLLVKSDVPGLTNADRPSVLVALTCSIGRFEMPGYDSLGEDLVRHANGGAVAVWAPSGLSINDRATELGDAFLKAVYEDGVGVMGDAILQGSATYGEDEAWLSYIYNLLGDPALRLLPSAQGAGTQDAPLARRSVVEPKSVTTKKSQAASNALQPKTKPLAAGAAKTASAPQVLGSYASEAAGIVRIKTDQPERVLVRIDGVDVASLAVADSVIFYVPLADVQVELVLSEAPVHMELVDADPKDLESVVLPLSRDQTASFITEDGVNYFVVGFEGLPVVLDVSDPIAPRFLRGQEVENEGLRSIYFHVPAGISVEADDQ